MYAPSGNLGSPQSIVHSVGQKPSVSDSLTDIIVIDDASVLPITSDQHHDPQQDKPVSLHRPPHLTTETGIPSWRRHSTTAAVTVATATPTRPYCSSETHVKEPDEEQQEHQELTYEPACIGFYESTQLYDFGTPTARPQSEDDQDEIIPMDPLEDPLAPLDAPATTAQSSSPPCQSILVVGSPEASALDDNLDTSDLNDSISQTLPSHQYCPSAVGHAVPMVEPVSLPRDICLPNLQQTPLRTHLPSPENREQQPCLLNAVQPSIANVQQPTSAHAVIHSMSGCQPHSDDRQWAELLQAQWEQHTQRLHAATLHAIETGFARQHDLWQSTLDAALAKQAVQYEERIQKLLQEQAALQQRQNAERVQNQLQQAITCLQGLVTVAAGGTSSDTERNVCEVKEKERVDRENAP
eukprot:TRINITY_DN6350_c0_g1_i1.p1 TRINITY_DN6350_c0_g1~~TRINITY_DN6350_c0_g1_i1.p1  ORF type:complete len:411 (+),score=55.76 TRINITY_DN6350_c0_g1_i1:1344-2576(+)